MLRAGLFTQEVSSWWQHTDLYFIGQQFNFCRWMCSKNWTWRFTFTELQQSDRWSIRASVQRRHFGAAVVGQEFFRRWDGQVRTTLCRPSADTDRPQSAAVCKVRQQHQSGSRRGLSCCLETVNNCYFETCVSYKPRYLCYVFDRILLQYTDFCAPVGCYVVMEVI